MEVRSFKLTTGEELIAELISTKEENSYLIRRPLVVHMMRTPEGGANLGFAQWSMLHTDDPVTVFSHGLVAKPIAVLAEVESSYISNVSGIALPPAGTSGRILHG